MQRNSLFSLVKNQVLEPEYLEEVQNRIFEFDDIYHIPCVDYLPHQSVFQFKKYGTISGPDLMKSLFETACEARKLEQEQDRDIDNIKQWTKQQWKDAWHKKYKTIGGVPMLQRHHGQYVLNWNGFDRFCEKELSMHEVLKRIGKYKIYPVSLYLHTIFAKRSVLT